MTGESVAWRGNESETVQQATVLLAQDLILCMFGEGFVAVVSLKSTSGSIT